MSNHRRSRLVPNLECFEPRLTPTVGIGAALGGTISLGDLAELMAMFHQLAQQQIAENREMREVAIETQHEALQAQAEKLRQAAAAQFAAGVVSGAVSLGSGAISLGGGAMGLKGASRVKTLGNGELAHAGPTAGKTVQSGGLGQMIAQIGQVERSALHAMGDARQAGRKELEAEARQAKLHGQAQADLMQQMQATIQRVRDQLVEIANAQQEAMGTILKG